ncbi:hypothetical protein ACLB1T_17795 [Escherichia coli]
MRFFRRLLALLVIVATASSWMNFSQALPRSQWRTGCLVAGY